MTGCSRHRILVLFDWLVGFFSSLLCPSCLLFSAWEQTCGLPEAGLSSPCVACAPVSDSVCTTFLCRGLNWHFTCTFQTGHFWWPAPCQDSWCLAGALKSIRQYYGQSCAGNNQSKRKLFYAKKKKYILLSYWERNVPGCCVVWFLNG